MKLGDERCATSSTARIADRFAESSRPKPAKDFGSFFNSHSCLRQLTLSPPLGTVAR